MDDITQNIYKIDQLVAMKSVRLTRANLEAEIILHCLHFTGLVGGGNNVENSKARETIENDRRAFAGIVEELVVLYVRMSMAALLQLY